MAQYEREMEGAWDLNRQLKRRIAELAAQVQHLADINTERQLRIRQLEAMIIKNQAEDLKEQGE